jgi:hypothetical protein
MDLPLDAALFLLGFKGSEGFVAFKEISRAHAADIAAASKMRPYRAAYKPGDGLIVVPYTGFVAQIFMTAERRGWNNRAAHDTA